jgi:hypothetical protein
MRLRPLHFAYGASGFGVQQAIVGRPRDLPGPRQFHFEYPLIRDEDIPDMKGDLRQLHSWLAQAGV